MVLAVVLLAASPLAPVSPAAAPGPSPPTAGLIVEAVAEASGGRQAGIRAGDELVGWYRSGSPPGGGQAAGGFDCPFDLVRVEVEEGSRGSVTLRVRRDGRDLELAMPAAEWGLEVHPGLRGAALARYEAGRALAKRGERAGAIRSWNGLAEARARSGKHVEAAWLHLRTAELSASAGRLEEMALALDRALAEGALAERCALGGTVHLRVAAALGAAGEPRAAADLLARAAADLEAAGEGLRLAVVQAALGALHRELGDFPRSRDLLERSARLFERWAPRSYRRADTLRALAVTCFVQGDHSAGERAQDQALELLREVAPTSLAAARTLTNQASLLVRRGDLAGAEALYREADGVHEALGSPDASRGAVLANLATVALRRGDLLGAQAGAEEAVRLEEQRAPRSPRLAPMMGILGQIALARAEPARAAQWLRKALAVQDATAPDDPQAIALLATLSWASSEVGDPGGAEEALRVAVERLRRQPVRNLDVAAGLRALARVTMRTGDWRSAAQWLEQARQIDASLAADGPGMAEDLQLLGEVELAAGRLEAAQRHLGRALALWRQGAPGTLSEARCHHLLGKVRRARGRPHEALESFAEAIALVERQPRRPTTDYEALAEARERNRELFQDAVVLLLELGRAGDAFRVHEQSRARAFLDLLAMRDLALVPRPGPALERALQRANRAYDAALRAEVASNGDPGSAGARILEQTLAVARLGRQEALEQVARATPALDGLPGPETLNAASALELLDPGTVVLSYAVTEQRADLFVLGPQRQALAVHPLARSGADLRDRVDRFRGALQPGGSVAGVKALAAALGELLLSPAAERIARAERVVVVGDGPLHGVPFAALGYPGGRSEPFRYLIEEKPVSMVESVAALRRTAGAPGLRRATSIVAFGDPLYSAPSPLPAAGPRLHPLPATRREVEAIARVWPTSSRVFLGEEATEERAKATAPEAGILHFATHALVDERFPLESAIALSIPHDAGGENGLLQAWEILEQVRIDAGLVTLSGCDTASGRSFAGEGIVGLARAFRFAGARSLIASLWQVPDDSTSLLMVELYRNLGQGASTDEALRRAQSSLLREPGHEAYRHPYFWAAFQLIGDGARPLLPKPTR